MTTNGKKSSGGRKPPVKPTDAERSAAQQALLAWWATSCAALREIWLSCELMKNEFGPGGALTGLADDVRLNDAAIALSDAHIALCDSSPYVLFLDRPLAAATLE